MTRYALLLTALFALTACGEEDLSTITDCQECLDAGGTWQPEDDACTEDCALQDISCWEDECPGECATDACDNCFDQTECEAASCEWVTEGEGAWCTELLDS